MNEPAEQPAPPSEPGAPTEMTLQRRLGYAALSQLMIGLYFVSNRISANLAPHKLETPLDSLIAFNPAWEHIYITLYLFIVVPHVVIRDRGYLERFLKAFGVTQVIAAILFLSFPVHMDRPPVPTDGSFAAWIIGINYFLDNSSNGFPSLHVANAMLCAIAVLRVDKIVGLGWLTLAGLVALSTVGVKQHYAIDSVAGMLLALGAWWFFLRPYDLSGKTEQELRLPRTGSAALVALHVAAISGAFTLHRLGIRPWE